MVLCIIDIHILSMVLCIIDIHVYGVMYYRHTYVYGGIIIDIHNYVYGVMYYHRHTYVYGVMYCQMDRDITERSKRLMQEPQYFFRHFVGQRTKFNNLGNNTLGLALDEND